MQVIGGCIARSSHQADLLSLVDGFTFARLIFLEVRVGGLIAIAMTNHNDVSVRTVPPGKTHLAPPGRHHVPAGTSRSTPL